MLKDTVFQFLAAILVAFVVAAILAESYRVLFAMLAGLTLVAGLAYFLPRYWRSADEKKIADLRKGFTNSDRDWRGYVPWRTDVLTALYGTNNVFQLFGKRYCVVCVPMLRRYDWTRGKEFNDACELDATFKRFLPARSARKLVDEYAEVESVNVRYGNRVGFYLHQIELNEGRVSRIVLRATTFWDNVRSCQSLSYELWKAYRAHRDTARRSPQMYLPMRMALTQVTDAKPILDAASVPDDSYLPILGIEALLVLRHDRTEPWRFATWKRSNRVVDKQGYYQFPPAGIYELFCNDENHEPYNLIREFSVTSALLREFAEELFDRTAFEDNRNLTSAEIREYAKNRDLLNMLNGEPPRASWTLLGVVFNLEPMRCDLAFAIVVDQMPRNWHFRAGRREAAPNQFDLFSFKEIASRLGDDDAEPLCPASAGMLKLAAPYLQERGVLSDLDLQTMFA